MVLRDVELPQSQRSSPINAAAAIARHESTDLTGLDALPDPRRKVVSERDLGSHRRRNVPDHGDRGVHRDGVRSRAVSLVNRHARARPNPEVEWSEDGSASRRAADRKTPTAFLTWRRREHHSVVVIGFALDHWWQFRQNFDYWKPLRRPDGDSNHRAVAFCHSGLGNLLL